MDDDELLERAARAAGIEIKHESGGIFFYNEFDDVWRPLADDGDALRLAVKLRLIVACDASPFIGVSAERHPAIHIVEGEKDGDALASTRRAIVRAAAAIATAKS